MDQHSDPQYKTDDGSALRIWRDAAQNAWLSEQHGRPIFDEVVYVEVISPGSGNSTPIFEAVRYLAKEANASQPKYGMKYDEFKKYINDFDSVETRDASLAGTPLSQWAEMTRTMVASLKVAKIFTVEALAALPDGNLGVIGPDGRTWREKALAYIENAKGSSWATALAADLARSHEREADMQAQIKALSDKLDARDAEAAERKPQPTPPQVDIPAPLIPATASII
jgi:hypothetical protein